MDMRFIVLPGGAVVPEDDATLAAVQKFRNGDVIHADFKKARNPRFHRKYFALLNFAYDHWEAEQEKSFEQFREDLTILAGYYDKRFRLNGDMVLRPRSIKFGNMDDIEFERLYSKTVDVILKHVLTKYTRDDLDRVVDQLIGNFG
jgi:hypothetical protein